MILGLVQGATEFLPVSSTGHMRIIPALLHWDDPGAAFSAVVQLGPIVAIIAYFRADLIRYVAGIGRTIGKKDWLPAGDIDARLGWYTLIGTLPLAVFGLLLEHKVDYALRWLNYDAWAQIVMASLLLLSERMGRRSRGIESLTLRDTIGIGLAQAVALIPGASRSGCTITAALFANLDRQSAARFSFLLSIPAITLAGLYKLAKTMKQTHLGAALGPYLLASLVAAVVAYVVIAMFLGYVSEEKHSTMPFIVYRVLLGIAMLVLLHTGYLHKDSGLPKNQTAAVSSPALTRTADSGANYRSKNFVQESGECLTNIEISDYTIPVVHRHRTNIASSGVGLSPKMAVRYGYEAMSRQEVRRAGSPA